MDIIQFSSGDWPEEELYGLVGHSYRVMAKAKNYDELVVGLMHAFYAASSITRERYYKEMFRGDYEWRTALELFVPPLPDRRFKAREAVSEEYLLGLNMPRFLSEAERNAWVLEQTTFTLYIIDNRRANGPSDHGNLADVLSDIVPACRTYTGYYLHILS